MELGFGKECQAINLIRNHDWSGLLIDSDIEAVTYAQTQFALASGVQALEAHVTAENINGILENYAPPEIDLLSIDIDGMDYWVWRAISTVKPRVVCIEYNASYGPNTCITVPYNPYFNRLKYAGTYHGASLQALTKLAHEKGMKLVGCESHGINAFYVQKNLPLPEVTVENAYFDHARRGCWQDELRKIKHYIVLQV